ncbi:hypothetical protein EJ08DRAFT_691623 [Tothia fuscella]|uniref:Uncharacterized protein n=1 Tax=Tothia fuscella TaxID=1048955 RepID=A0A9P4P387_9PEZI|nr:hypothetical protein EJ08DRAFT_691623 [Tothia fuscella]
MCIHKFYIFVNCGHNFFAPGALLPCPDATFPSLPPSQHYRLSRKSTTLQTHTPTSTTCTPTAHPYRTIRIRHGLCLDCEVRRKYLLAQAEQDVLNVVTVDESKWRVQYASEKKRGGGKGKGNEGSWLDWGEPAEQSMGSAEMVAAVQRQRAKGGRVGFSGEGDGSPSSPGMPSSSRAGERKSGRSS